MGGLVFSYNHCFSSSGVCSDAHTIMSMNPILFSTFTTSICSRWHMTNLYSIARYPPMKEHGVWDSATELGLRSPLARRWLMDLPQTNAYIQTMPFLKQLLY
ncbi:hypothetical protein DPSP01_000639 [Paraphaeosphaeria sporulosa]